MEEQKWELYIPVGVKAENELFNGFGRRELLQSMAGSLLGAGIAFLLWLKEMALAASNAVAPS